jgi:2-polyprenyl-3-methyl-5-hydroxy-6-metoxy-1,4-benzoquinol methylase
MGEFFGTSSSDKAKNVYSDIKIDPNMQEFKLGPYNSYHLLADAKRMGFLFSRYKFVAKMFTGYKKVLEIGCQEGIGSLVVAQEVEYLLATDFYMPHIESCQNRLAAIELNIDFKAHDITGGPVVGEFDGAFSLDVLEHIDSLQENEYMKNIVNSLSKHGVLIIGTPSLESQQYASIGSKVGHINCKTGAELRTLCQEYFHNVFIFSMNDEVVHTGFLPMAHYLIALCSYPK